MEDLEEIHDEEKVEVPLRQDLSHGQDGGGPRQLLFTLREEGFLRVSFTFKMPHMEHATVKAGSCQEGGDDGDDLKIGQDFHVVRDEATEEDTGGAQQGCHLVDFHQLQLALVPGESLCKRWALGLPHPAKGAVKRAQGDDQMKSLEPVTFLIVSPREPREQEGRCMQKGSKQGTVVTQTAIILRVP